MKSKTVSFIVLLSAFISLGARSALACDTTLVKISGNLDPASTTHMSLHSPRVSLGSKKDIPLTGDFDGDGITDFSVYRPSTGTVFTRVSALQIIGLLQTGKQKDKIIVQAGHK